MQQTIPSKQLPQIAVIGAGMAGLSLAHMLEPYARITLFEKSAGVGGRMSTRYAGEHQFDHGAQYFTARSKAFKRFLIPIISAGGVKQWTPHVITLGGTKKPYKRDWFEPHYVATPKMNQLGKFLAEGKNILLATEISALEKTLQGWLLKDTSGVDHHHFDWLISTAPAPQTAKLLPTFFSDFDKIQNTKMVGCYCLMLGFDEPLPIPWQAALVKHSCIGWIAIDSCKPDRNKACSLVVHSTNKWAEARLNDDQDEVEQLLFEELKRLLGSSLAQPCYKSLHRWRYANTLSSVEENYLIDPALKMGVCADWLMQGNVESAFLSALELSNHIKALLAGERIV